MMKNYYCPVLIQLLMLSLSLLIIKPRSGWGRRLVYRAAGLVAVLLGYFEFSSLLWVDVAGYAITMFLILMASRLPVTKWRIIPSVVEIFVYNYLSILFIAKLLIGFNLIKFDIPTGYFLGMQRAAILGGISITFGLLWFGFFNQKAVGSVTNQSGHS